MIKKLINSSILAFILALIVVTLVSWGVVLLFVWLISLCFEFAFTVKIATGVWLVILMLNLSLKISTKGGN